MNAARATLLVAMLFAASTAHAITIGSITLTDLGAGVVPNALNNVGQVVGQDASGQAFLWQLGAFTPLGTLGGSQSCANDINDNGWVVGWSQRASGIKSFCKWVGGIGIDMNASLNIESAAEAINDQGDAVGWMRSGNQYRSLLIGNDDGKTSLFGPANTQSFGINAKREVVGVIRNSSGGLEEGIYWDGLSSSSEITSGLGSYHPLAGINDNGLSAGEADTMGAYWLVGEGYNHISKIASGDIAEVRGLNDQCLLVGKSGNKAFLADLGQDLHNTDDRVFSLNNFLPSSSPFTQLTIAQDINNSGMFVGIGLIDGIYHGFVGQITTLLPVSHWKSPNGGTFTEADNWTNNNVPNSVDAVANFSSELQSPTTITLNTPVTLGAIEFSSLYSYPPQPFIIAGSPTLTLEVSSGKASIYIFRGSHEIAVPIVLASDTLIINEAEVPITGTITLSGGISGPHSLTITHGIVNTTSIDVATLEVRDGVTLNASSIVADTLIIGSGQSAAQAVPEPSTCLLLGMGLLAWALRKKLA